MSKMHAGFEKLLMFHVLLTKFEEWLQHGSIEENFSMHFEKKIASFCLLFAKFYFLKKLIENLFWYFYKIFHAA